MYYFLWLPFLICLAYLAEFNSKDIKIKDIAVDQIDQSQVSANINSEDLDPRINISADLSAEDSANTSNSINEPEVSDQDAGQNIKEVLKSDQSSYLILARMYKEKARAYYNGSVLQKKGLPVFLQKAEIK